MSGASKDGKEGMIDLTYRAEESGNHYVYVEADRMENIDVVYESGDVLTLREDCGAVVNIGWIEKGETFTIEMDYEMDGAGTIRSHVCTMDQDAWDKAYGMISSDLMTVTDFGDTFFEGTVSADADGILTTSVMNEQGWTLRVDGKKKEIYETVGGDFIAVPLSAGDHTIRLSFRPPGFIAGLILAVLAVLLLVLLVRGTGWLRRRRALQEDRSDSGYLR